MIATLALLGVFHSSGFPSAPIKAELEAGRRIARAKPGPSLGDLFRASSPRAAASRIWGCEKRPVGWWSNGYEQKPVEYVVWLSPDLVSRWFGLLSAREYWPDALLQARWDEVSEAIGGRRVFIVQLSAFPKMPTYEIGDYQRTVPDETLDVRFVYTAKGTAREMDAIQMAAWQSRDRASLDGFAWWQVLPFGDALTGEFEGRPQEPPLPVGDYHRSWYLVWADDVDDPTFEVRVLSKRKERVAKYRVRQRSSATQ